MHSERSAQSLRSSFSSHSRQVGALSPSPVVTALLSALHSQELIFLVCCMFSQSQVYRNHGVTAASYEAPPPPGSLPGDYAYGAYGSNFGSAQGFPEYGYPAEGGWPATEQGICVVGTLCSYRYTGMLGHC